MSYDPTIGRWLETDPAGYVDGMNLYKFVKDAPISATDPMGLFTQVSSYTASGNGLINRYYEGSRSRSSLNLEGTIEFSFKFDFGEKDDGNAYINQAKVTYSNVVGDLDSVGFSILVVGATVSDRVDSDSSIGTLSCGGSESDITFTWIRRYSVGFNPGIGPISIDLGASEGTEKALASTMRDFRAVFDPNDNLYLQELRSPGKGPRGDLAKVWTTPLNIAVTQNF